MNIYYCRLCGKKIPLWIRCNALFCSQECKKIEYEITHGRAKPNYIEERFGLKISKRQWLMIQKKKKGG